MLDDYLISYQTTFDAARRVCFSDDPISRCGNLCGHRYTVQAICQGSYVSKLQDATFLKHSMNECLKDHLDHSLMLSADDPLLYRFLDDKQREKFIVDNAWQGPVPWYGQTDIGQIVIIPYPPISEYLAKFCFEQLTSHLAHADIVDFRLVTVRVWETPNWFSEISNKE